MIIRIVKMEFQEQHSNEFEAFSAQIHATIRSFEGCQHLEIYRDIVQPNIFFSYSHWQSEEQLNAYRQSDFFRQTWARTKAMFAQRAQAWSVQTVVPANKN